jgi:hypothetical protein
MQMSASFLVAFPTTPWRKDKHQEGNNKKNVNLEYRKDHMLIKIKGYAKPTKHQLEVDMEYDDENEDMVNSNGKH